MSWWRRSKPAGGDEPEDPPDAVKITGARGTYRLLDEIGLGGFSTAFRAAGPHGEVVVAKVARLKGGSATSTRIQGQFAARGFYQNTGEAGGSFRTLSSAEVEQIFASEQRLLYSADSDRFARLVDVGRLAGRPVLLLEELPTRWALTSADPHEFVELLRALADLKGTDLGFHGDLKPEHVFRDSDGALRFIDPGYRPDDGMSPFRTTTAAFDPFWRGGVAKDVVAVAVMAYLRYAGGLPVKEGGRFPALATTSSAPSGLCSWVDELLNAPWASHGPPRPLLPEWVLDHGRAAEELEARLGDLNEGTAPHSESSWPGFTPGELLARIERDLDLGRTAAAREGLRTAFGIRKLLSEDRAFALILLSRAAELDGESDVAEAACLVVLSFPDADDGLEGPWTTLVPAAMLQLARLYRQRGDLVSMVLALEVGSGQTGMQKSFDHEQWQNAGRCLLALAQAQQEAGSLQLAERTYWRCVLHQGDSAGLAALTLGALLEGRGDTTAAADAYRHGIVRGDRDEIAESRLRLAAVMASTSRRECDELLQQVLELEDWEYAPRAAIALAKLRAAEGRPEAAESLLAAFADTPHPVAVQAKVMLGVVLMARNAPNWEVDAVFEGALTALDWGWWWPGTSDAVIEALGPRIDGLDMQGLALVIAAYDESTDPSNHVGAARSAARKMLRRSDNYDAPGKYLSRAAEMVEDVAAPVSGLEMSLPYVDSGWPHHTARLRPAADPCLFLPLRDALGLVSDPEQSVLQEFGFAILGTGDLAPSAAALMLIRRAAGRHDPARLAEHLYVGALLARRQQYSEARVALGPLLNTSDERLAATARWAESKWQLHPDE